MIMLDGLLVRVYVYHVNIDYVMNFIVKRLV